jgi:hypothetical protein
MTKLYRPVGLEELALVWDSGYREFPPRQPDQPIFYPVTSAEYATQIARDWNTKSSSYAGYVTSFDVDDYYRAMFDRHIVGATVHEEYWIPANELADFNKAVWGQIEVDAAFFGPPFAGFIPDKAGLQLGLQSDGFHPGDLGQSEGGISELPILGHTRFQR